MGVRQSLSTSPMPSIFGALRTARWAKSIHPSFDLFFYCQGFVQGSTGKMLVLLVERLCPQEKIGIAMPVNLIGHKGEAKKRA